MTISAFKNFATDGFLLIFLKICSFSIGFYQIFFLNDGDILFF